MRIKATINVEVDPKDYVNCDTGILEVPIINQDHGYIHELLSEIYSNIISIEVEEVK